MKAAIAGAGLVGRLLALQLCQLGWHVTLFDRDNKAGAQSCGFAAGGMLSPLAELEAAEPLICALGRDSMQRWPQIIASLDAPVTFAKNGSLLVAHHQDSPDLQRYVAIIREKLVAERLAIMACSSEQLRALEPDFSAPGMHSYFLPEEGYIDNQQLFVALTQRLLQAGVIWHEHCAVEQLQPGQITTAIGKYSFDWVFDCRGLGAKSSWPGLRGVRGELMWLHAPEVTLTRPIRLMHPRYALYVVPRADNHYLVGASALESEDFSAISVRSCMELLSAAYTLHPGFAEARIVKTVVNCRPALADNLPCIRHQPGLIRINGLYRHGYLLAPALVQDTMRLLAAKTADPVCYPQVIQAHDSPLMKEA